MIKFIVDGTRWFDKVNGNTYHKVTITDATTNCGATAEGTLDWSNPEDDEDGYD